MPEITCPSCGKQLTEYVRFCPECGARIPEPEAAAPTIVLPPASAPPSPPTPAPGGFPPTQRLDVPQPPPPQSYGEPQPPPPLPAGTLPGSAPYGSPYPTPEAAPPRQRRTLWWILGGVGCLGVLLVGACISIGFLSLLGQQVSEIETAPTVQTGGGGIVPDDSPLTGGDVLLSESFDGPGSSDFEESEDESSRYAFEDGTYIIEVKEPETIVWSMVSGSYSDISFEVEAEVPAEADVSAVGLIFHYQDNDNFYLYSVSNDGYYALEVLEGDQWTTLIDWTQSDEIEPARNTLRVETSGERIALYVNGTLLEETSDGTFTEGEAGIAVSSFEDSTAAVRFDNLEIARNE